MERHPCVHRRACFQSFGGQSSSGRLRCSVHEVLGTPSFPEHKCVLLCQIRQHHCKHSSGERIDSSGLVLMEWHKLWNQQQDHTPQWRSMTRVSLQRDRATHHTLKSGISRKHSWLFRLRRTEPQTFDEISTDTCRISASSCICKVTRNPRNSTGLNLNHT